MEVYMENFLATTTIDIGYQAIAVRGDAALVGEAIGNEGNGP